MPGFATPTTNSYVTVQILNKLGGTQVSNAAVSVNGVALDYNTQFADYEGPLTVSAGDTVQLTVALNGSTYTVAATQVASYPAIGAPLANANWANGSSNLLSWSAPLIGPANTSYAIGVFGSNASLVWPANGKAQILPTSTTSYSIGAGNLAPGNGWVFAAQTYSVSIANADPSSSMQFPGQSQISAANNGIWQPAPGGNTGSAPADYGGQINFQYIGTTYAALRNVVLDVTSPLLPVNNGNFDSSALVFSFAPNANATLDYSTFNGAGSQPLTGYSTNSVLNGATLATNGTRQTLTIYVQTQFTFSLINPNDTTLNLNGQIVATNSPPLFQSITLTNQTLVLTVQNATGQSVLQSSPDLTAWSAANPAVTTNGPTSLTYTVPLTGGNSFFRVEQ